MKTLYLLLIAALCTTGSSIAQLQSPEQFLGYKLGTRYTPHFKIVNYVRAVAAARPDMVKVEKYGETNEGRELLLLYIANPQNLQRLEDIRLNNLRLAGSSKDKTAGATENAPAIVWLSYNVHGNETSSSEAAMLTLYTLVNPDEARSKEWLKNTVIIIDPCINPDGRDRYVNWFNSVADKTMDPDPQAREHDEPWPGGRSNHYNFDLNRDWAWQTQVETQQRMVKYNQWLPQVHVDYHEQGYNQPYYFAPAAEPYHDVITPWQREFQNLIGRNNAHYFDQNGWLYFTKERFDLFYPSYGDTYPIYSGAIGMTFEQGGIRSGLSVITNAGDTLTLVDRINHHYTTGLSTIEVASANAPKLLSEFKKFFADSKSPKPGNNKTYVLTSDNHAKITSIAHLLQVNGIEYGSVTADKSFSGFDYTSGKEGKGELKKYNIAVNTAQARSVLASVLLEPKSHLVDSNTYDITAWSIPYAYGVDAYVVSTPLALQPFAAATANKPIIPSTYGYLVKYNSVNSVKVLAQLLKQGIKVRYTKKPFTYKQNVYGRGTLIILQKNNPANLLSLLNTYAADNDVEMEAVESGFMDKGPDFGSPDIKAIAAPKVALLTGEQTSSLAAGEVWNFFEQQIKYPLTLINTERLGRVDLKNYTVLIMPDGVYDNINDKALADKLKDFVKRGGTLIALENAVKQLAEGDWGIKLKDDKDADKDKDKDKKPDYSQLKRYENRERDDLVNSIPGAIFKVDLDNSHPLAFGYPDTYYTLKQDPNVYEFLKDGWNVGVVKKDNYVTGFAGNKVKNQLKDGLLFGVEEMGRGSLVVLADNPLFRQFWEGGKLLFCNAVFLVGQ